MGLHLNPIEGSHCEPDDGEDYDHLLEAGWWDDQKAEAVTNAIQALMATAIYEDRQMAKGISVEFIMRLNLLKSAAELDVSRELVDEAKRYFATKATTS
jgi:hypothetical protein